VSRLHHRAADSTAVHSLSPTTWLSGVRPKPTQGVDAYAGITADQIAAAAIGQDTLLPSMELATEDHSGLIGACDRDYGCIYMNTLSWRTPTTPMPMEINPRKVFDDYLEGVREIERRLSRAESQIEANADLVIPEAPSGIPFQYEDHVRTMFDMLALSFSADITRVFTFMMAREVSNRTYTQVGVTEGHHAVSHHQNKQEKLDMLARIQAFHIGLFGEFLAKLDATPDGEGSLLDNSVLLYGSNMSNSNAHDHYPLPNIVVGGGRGKLKGGQHILCAEHTPMTNLLVTMLDKADVPVETLGDSTGRIAEI
jgi:hypothetical protein